jgi:hypothetical protein
MRFHVITWMMFMPRKIPIYDDYEMIGRLRLDPGLALANSDPLLLRRGLVTGGSVVHKYGRNEALPNGTWEGILQVAAQFPWLTAATTVRIQSGGDAEDDGTVSPLEVGALEVTVQGLNAAGAVVTEAITTNGASASTSTTTEFFRVNRAWVSQAGAYTGVNTGDVTIENTAGTVDLIMIAAGEGQSQFGAFTIPASRVGYLASVILGADGLKAADFRLYTRENANNVTAPFTAKRIKLFWDGVLGSVTHKPTTPALVLPAWTDIWLEGAGHAVGTEATGNMEIILYDV